MRINELKKYKRILTLGHGVEGKSSYDFIKKYCPNTEIGISDIKDGVDYLDKQNEYDLIIKSPGISKRLLKKPHTAATNIFFANFKGIIIGITGTKGKSTTSTLIYQMLKAAGRDVFLAGNIGTPALSYLSSSNTSKTICVMELSSYQLDDICYSPHVVVITSIFPDHINYHNSFENYLTAKLNICRFQNKQDWLIYDSKGTDLHKYLNSIKSKKIEVKHNKLTETKKLKIIGEHNIKNINLAASVAEIFSVKSNVIQTVISNFEGLPHRLQNLGTFSGITFIDDAASTTPESTILAIRSIDKINTILLGGLDRGYNFELLCRTIDKSSIENIVLFKDTGFMIKEKLAQITKRKFNYLHAASMEEAVLWVYRVTRANTVCLLSSASPSYTLWKNFTDKGNQFKRFVLKFAS